MSPDTSKTDLQPTYKTPRWVKVIGIVALGLILLVGIMLLSGEHGPGRHMPSNNTESATSPASTTEDRMPTMELEEQQP
jgi:hypothetical protein